MTSPRAHYLGALSSCAAYTFLTITVQLRTQGPTSYVYPTPPHSVLPTPPHSSHHHFLRADSLLYNPNDHRQPTPHFPMHTPHSHLTAASHTHHSITTASHPHWISWLSCPSHNSSDSRMSFSVSGWYGYTYPELPLLPPLLQCQEDNISDLDFTSLHSSSPTLLPSSSNTS